MKSSVFILSVVYIKGLKTYLAGFCITVFYEDHRAEGEDHEDGGVNEILFANGAFITPYDYPSYYVADANGNEFWVSYEQLIANKYTQLGYDFSIVPNPETELEA